MFVNIEIGDARMFDNLGSMTVAAVLFSVDDVPAVGVVGHGENILPQVRTALFHRRVEMTLAATLSNAQLTPMQQQLLQMTKKQ